jgi:hypothetical protein
MESKKTRLVKGSDEAKEFMKNLRSKRGMKKDDGNTSPPQPPAPAPASPPSPPPPSIIPTVEPKQRRSKKQQNISVDF